MKTKMTVAIIATLWAGLAATAIGAPPSKRSAPVRAPAAAPTEQLCAICQDLAARPGRPAQTINGRVYDPKLSCHRVLVPVAKGSRKAASYTTECVCS